MKTASETSSQEEEILTRIPVYDAERYLFRGTSLSHYLNRLVETGGEGHYGTICGDGELLTSCSVYPMMAMTQGKKRSNEHASNGDVLADPILLAIDVTDYDTGYGLEDQSGEVEVYGRINPAHTTIIRDVETLRRFAKESNPDIERYFLEHFARPLPKFSDKEIIV